MTALQDLLAAKRASSPEAATASRQPVEDEPGAPMPVSEPDDKEKPWGVAQVVTPSGLEIYYQAGPKRLYRLCMAIPDVGRSDWIEVPSMSEIKDILDKPALPWWGMKIGVEGVARLYREYDHGQVVPLLLEDVNVEQLVELLKVHKLTVNHQRDKAADRGTNVHKAVEYWADNNVLPDPEVYPAHERGYVEGVRTFLIDSMAVAKKSEVMVGSLEWGFAGRFDLIAELNGDVVTHYTPKGRGDRNEKVTGRWLLDLKTSKDVYSSHHLQCAGYELAYQESYGQQTDHQGVIQVSEDGRYKLVKSRATVDDFQNLKCLYDSLKAIG